MDLFTYKHVSFKGWKGRRGKRCLLEGNWRGNVRGGGGRGGEKGGRYLLIMLDAEIQEHGDDEGGVLVVPVVGEFFAG